MPWTALTHLKGAMFSTPAAETEETKAIGLATTPLMKVPYNFLFALGVSGVPLSAGAYLLSSVEASITFHPSLTPSIHFLPSAVTSIFSPNFQDGFGFRVSRNSRGSNGGTSDGFDMTMPGSD